MENAHNVVLIGGPGTGKTHIATALGIQAIEHHRLRVGFFSTVELVNALEQEKAQGKAGQIAERLVRSDLVILDYDMPRNLFSPTCLHTLYDAGCGVIRGTYSVNGTAGAGSTSNQILTSVAQAGHAQGSLVWTSGANANVRSTVKSVAVGSALNLMYPLPFAPTTGDAFTVAFGCNHTQATCQGTFNNLANFRGFPYVPPPELAY